ncbi:MAG: AAA family ATPase [Acetobacteraceae bacterium]
MAREPIDDIEAWSKKLSLWRQDCLRRLAASNELTDTDLDELLALVKSSAGFTVEPKPPAPIAFTKAHFGGGSHRPIVLKGIADVQNVNRLVPKAGLTFCPRELTIIYGRNGSGKSGFVRILRTACRTRIEHPARLKVLPNAYRGVGGPQAAQIIIDAGAGDVPIPWTPGAPVSAQLMQVSVFDAASAQLYVDGGNQIRYLPFGLALPHRLNTVCLTLKERLESERAAAVGNKVNLTTIAFPFPRDTKAQSFERALSTEVSNAEIGEAAHFEPEDQVRLEHVSATLSTGAEAAADLAPLVAWLERLASECDAAATAFCDTALAGLTMLKSAAAADRQAAMASADKLFADEPLPGVASESWRKLWMAARDYSISEAYRGHVFPVTATDKRDAVCVLCAQPLLADGASRFQRFQDYMDGTLGLAATEAERAVSEAAASIPELKLLRAGDFADRLRQIRKRDGTLADALSTFQISAASRRADAMARVAGQAAKPQPSLANVQEDVRKLAARLRHAEVALAGASDAHERQQLTAESAELEDRKILAANCAKLITRRDLMVTDAAFARALAEVQTKGITQRANELVDQHLTAAVAARFDAERARFDIAHLKLGLSRRSGRTKAEFDVALQTKLTKVTSEILSEGEQHALALAAFLTEVALTEDSGPIVVDDPVSSLDRDRSARVAARLAEEARNRQVIVFTHDMIFVNELCRAAEAQGIEPATIALFGDKEAAGKVDTAGMTWKGLNVAKRIARIKNDFAPLAKLHASSPSDYEYQIKNLYGRLRDTYERVVEEVIFHGVVQRGTDVIQTQFLRYVSLSGDHAIRFHKGMTRASTYSHDNPAAETVPVPTPSEVKEDVAALEQLVKDLQEESLVAEIARPEMRPKR